MTLGTHSTKSKHLYMSFCHTHITLYNYVYCYQNSVRNKLQTKYLKHTNNIHLSYRSFRVKKKTAILNIRIPDELILDLDSLIKKRIFKSRSEAIREFARVYVQEQEHTKQNAKNFELKGGDRW